MVHSMEYRKDGTAHGNLAGLLGRISLGLEYGSEMGSSVGSSFGFYEWLKYFKL